MNPLHAWRRHLRSPRWLILSTTLCLACSTAAPDVVDEATAGRVRAEVAAAFDTVSKAITTHDWDQLEPFIADGDDVALAMDGQVIVGRGPIMAGFRADSSIVKYLDYRWEKTHIRVLGASAAVHATGFWERLAMRSGDTVEIQGTFTNAFQKVNGRWQVVHMAASHATAAK